MVTFRTEGDVKREKSSCESCGEFRGDASGYKIAEEPLPGKAVLSYYWNYGGRKVTVGSDAHRSTDVGNHFARIQDLLSKVGVTYMTGYEKRNAVKIDII